MIVNGGWHSPGKVDPWTATVMHPRTVDGQKMSQLNKEKNLQGEGKKLLYLESDQRSSKCFI